MEAAWLQPLSAYLGPGALSTIIVAWALYRWSRNESREEDQQTASERKEASAYMLEALKAARQDAEQCRRDLTAEREANRTKDIRLAEKREAIAELERTIAAKDRTIRAMDNVAHWFRHEAAALVQKAYAAGWLRLPMPREAAGLPMVPRIEEAGGWQPPAHSYASPEEIAATFHPPAKD